MEDDDGIPVKAGDWITFSYGIPPVRVDARLSTENGKLIATCLGHHRPRVITLRALRRYVGNWYWSPGPRKLCKPAVETPKSAMKSRGHGDPRRTAKDVDSK